MLSFRWGCRRCRFCRTTRTTEQITDKNTRQDLDHGHIKRQTNPYLSPFSSSTLTFLQTFSPKERSADLEPCVVRSNHAPTNARDRHAYPRTMPPDNAASFENNACRPYYIQVACMEGRKKRESQKDHTCGEQLRKQHKASSVRRPFMSRCTYSSSKRAPCISWSAFVSVTGASNTGSARAMYWVPSSCHTRLLGIHNSLLCAAAHPRNATQRVERAIQTKHKRKLVSPEPSPSTVLSRPYRPRRERGLARATHVHDKEETHDRTSRQRARIRTGEEGGREVGRERGRQERRRDGADPGVLR